MRAGPVPQKPEAPVQAQQEGQTVPVTALGAGTMPPTHGITQVGMTVTQSEFIMTFGHTRIPIGATGQPAGIAIEWLASFSMNATVAKQLAVGLAQSIAQFEKMAGPIYVPKPPASRKKKPVRGNGHARKKA